MIISFVFHLLQNDQKEATQINRPKTLKQIRYCFVCSQKYCIMFLLNRQLPSKPLPKTSTRNNKKLLAISHNWKLLYISCKNNKLRISLHNNQVFKTFNYIFNLNKFFRSNVLEISKVKKYLRISKKDCSPQTSIK